MSASESLRRLGVGTESLERPVWWGLVGGLVLGYGAVPVVGGGVASAGTYVLAVAVLSALAALARAVGAGGLLACVALAFGPLAGALVGAGRHGAGSDPGVDLGVVPPEFLGGSIPTSLGIALAAALAIGGVTFLLGELIRRIRADR